MGQHRNIALDIIRTIAIILVLLNHSVESLFKLEEYDYAVAYNSMNNSGITLTFTLGRLGVPLFLMLTGYLLLNRDFDKPGAIKKFWLKNTLSLIITWEIWLFLYNLFLCFYNNTPFDVTGWIRQMCFVELPEITHSWYLPMIIGIYIFIPFIAKGIHNVPKYALYIMLAVCYAALFIVPSINVFYSTFDIEPLTLRATPVFWATYNGTFLLLGHLLNIRTKAIRCLPLIDIAVCVTGIWVSVWLQVMLHAGGSQYNIWYSFFTLPPVAYCLFDLLVRIKPQRGVAFIKRISICSFGIYLIHRPLQMLLEMEGSFFTNMCSTLPSLWTMWLLLVFSFFISYGITEGLGAIPIIGNLLVRIRVNIKKSSNQQKPMA